MGNVIVAVSTADVYPAFTGGITAQNRPVMHEYHPDTMTRCGKCGTTFVPGRLYCERCFAEIDASSWFDAGTTGCVHTFTVMHIGLEGKPLASPRVDLGALSQKVLEPSGMKVGLQWGPVKVDCWLQNARMKILIYSLYKGWSMMVVLARCGFVFYDLRESPRGACRRRGRRRPAPTKDLSVDVRRPGLHRRARTRETTTA